MKINPSIFIIIILFVTTGCYTTQRFELLKIEVLQPAIIGQSGLNSKTAILYNNSNLLNDSINSAFIYNDKVLTDTVNTDSLASVVYYESFINTLNAENYSDSICELERQFPDVGNDSIKIFTKQEVNKIKKTYNCNTVYSLNRFTINEISYTNQAYNETGILIFMKAIWAVYGSFPDTTFLILHRDTITFSGTYSNYRTEIKILADRPDLIMETSADLGKRFALFLIPHWEEVKRLYYKSGNLLFKEADKFAQNNEWLKAAEIWKKLTTNKNKNIVVKSMYNLALACEMEGDLDAALDWVIKSLQVFGQKNTKHAYNCLDYINILTTRKLEIKKLQYQVSE